MLLITPYQFKLYPIIADKMYQYFIKIVPTKVKTHFVEVDTYQFSVTEHVSFKDLID